MHPGSRDSQSDTGLPRLPFEDPVSSLEPSREPPKAPLTRMRWVFLGEKGLRAGWSVILFYLLYKLFLSVLGTVVLGFFPSLANYDFSAGVIIASELIGLFAVFGAVLAVVRLEGRSVQDLYLRDSRGTRRFVAGLISGFTALSALVAVMWAGGWMQLSVSGLPAVQVVQYAALWAFAFLLTGLLEEGAFRSFLLFTFTRGINFWWAFALVSALCMRLLLFQSDNSVWGVYLMALLGLIPCLILHNLKAQSAGFWQAAWVTSTLFGYWHTNNHGENQIGIFAAAAIGFVFCVSVRLTGSVWWAIGCHMAWDWGETFFYGTPDSGLVAPGHVFSAQPQGNTLMSGGTVGPEGSVMALLIILLLLGTVMLMYRRKTSRPELVSPPA